MQKIKIVFFDFGGVLVDGTSSRTFRYAAKLSGIPEARIRELFYKRHHLHQTGRENLTAAWRTILQQEGLDAKRSSAIAKRVVNIYRRFGRPHSTVFAIVRDLERRGMRVGLLSDTCEEHARTNFRNGYYRHFRPLVLSHRVGAKKPYAKIFRIALRRAGVKAAEAVFIDDYLTNIRTARRLGFHAIHFRNARQLARVLRKVQIA